MSQDIEERILKNAAKVCEWMKPNTYLSSYFDVAAGPRLVVDLLPESIIAFFRQAVTDGESAALASGKVEDSMLAVVGDRFYDDAKLAAALFTMILHEKDTDFTLTATQLEPLANLMSSRKERLAKVPGWETVSKAYDEMISDLKTLSQDKAPWTINQSTVTTLLGKETLGRIINADSAPVNVARAFF